MFVQRLMWKTTVVALATATLALSSCGGDDSADNSGPSTTQPTPPPSPKPISTTTGASANGLMSVKIERLATLATPYAVAPMTDGQALYLEAFNGIKILHLDGSSSAPVTGVPKNFFYPFDLILAPDFTTSHRIFVSYAEFGPDRGETQGADDGLGNGANLAVFSGILTIGQDGSGTLTDSKVIWRQVPRELAAGEFGARMVFSPDSKYLFITAGDRSTFQPAQDNANTLGKIVRIFPDGSIPLDNPYSGQSGLRPEIWTTGHRNPYGIAFDAQGRLWEHENGPKGGDELNLIKRGANYGWPLVSWGNHYDDGPIPKPKPGDGFVEPAVDWTPAIAPSGLVIYNAALFPKLVGHAIIGGMQAKGLVLVQLNGETAKEVDRLDLGARIRDVRQGPDGAIWVLEDAPTGNLLRLIPN